VATHSKSGRIILALPARQPECNGCGPRLALRCSRPWRERSLYARSGAIADLSKLGGKSVWRRCEMILPAEADRRQKFNGNSSTAILQVFDSQDFAQVVSIDCPKTIRIGEHDKKPHVFLVASAVCCEVATRAAGIQADEHFIEPVESWLGRPSTQQERNSCARPMTLFPLHMWAHMILSVVFTGPSKLLAS